MGGVLCSHRITLSESTVMQHSTPAHNTRHILPNRSTRASPKNYPHQEFTYELFLVHQDHEQNTVTGGLPIDVTWSTIFFKTLRLKDLKFLL